jgi:hypothetical protein
MLPQPTARTPRLMRAVVPQQERGIKVGTETRTKVSIYLVAVIVAAPLACKMAHCHDLVRLVWDKGNSHPAMLARFYFIVIMALVVIITQNSFIRRALRRRQSDDHQEAPSAQQEDVTDD